MSWLSFRRGESRDGVELLEQLVLRIPQKRNAIEQAYAEHVLEFAGRLVSFSRHAAPDNKRLVRADIGDLNKAVLRRDAELVDRYKLGFRDVSTAWEDLRNQLALASNPKEKATMQRVLTRLTYYIKDFDFGLAQQLLRAGLDE